MTALSTSPSYFEMASTETLPLALSFVPLLEEGESIESAVVTLTNTLKRTDHSASLVGDPDISAGVVTQVVTALLPGQRYRLAATATISATKTWTVALELVCVF